MITIRGEQMDALREAAKPHALGAVIRQLHPDACERLGIEGIEARIESGREQAAEHGITDEEDQQRIVDVLFLLDRDAFDQDWALAILKWGSPGDVRAAALEKRARIELERGDA